MNRPESQTHVPCSNPSRVVRSNDLRFHPYLIQPPSTMSDVRRRVLSHEADAYYYYWHCRNVQQMSRTIIQLQRQQQQHQHQQIMSIPYSETNHSLHHSSTSMTFPSAPWNRYYPFPHRPCDTVPEYHNTPHASSSGVIPCNGENTNTPRMPRSIHVKSALSLPDHTRNHNTETNKDENLGDDNETLCIICLDAKKSVLFLPCCHMCCCKSCGSNPSWRKNPSCPLCRAPIRGKTVVFW